MDDSNTSPDTGGTATSLTVAQGAAAIASLLDPPEEDTQPEDKAPKAKAAPAEEPEAEEEAEPEEGEAEAEEEADQSEEEQAEPEPKQESEPVKIKLDDGTEITLEEARLGYQRQADYTRKTQDLAREREAVRASKSQISQTEAEAKQAIQLAQTLIQSVMPPRPDMALLQSDPFEYQRQKAAWDSWQEWATTIDGESQRMEAARAAEFENGRVEYLKSEHQKLLEAMPELKDKAKREQWKQNLLSTLTESYGFTQEEILSAADHRQLRMATDAAKWRALQKSKVKVMEKAKDAPPVQKPGVRPSPAKAQAQVQKAKVERLRQTGRVEDAARAIADLL